MNKRILELKAQCYISIVDRDGDNAYDMDKFARLLILECAKFLDERCSSDNCNNVLYPEPEELLKHFGVKE
jgi:hypothetical protein